MFSSNAIQVLLGTFNGDRFLREQIDSILNQSYREVYILARDDGSSDATPVILAEYAARFPQRITVLREGRASGSAKNNFMRLIEASHAPYLAFADQDDVWMPEKLTMSMEAMRSMEQQHPGDRPRLVFTDLIVVDQTLCRIQPSFWTHQSIDPRRIHRLSRLLTGNVATGCTMLFNRALARLASPLPSQAFMHDWWLALLAASFGDATALSTPTVLYRQHDRNVVGAVTHPRVTGIPRWRYHEKRRQQWEMVANQAAALLTTHGSALSTQNRRALEALVRCETSPSRWVRAWTYVRHGFSFDRVRPTLAILWYLWDMNRAKRADSTNAHC